MKQCIDCEQIKDLSEYGPHKSTADKLMQRCKSCVSAYNKAYREKNKERLKQLNANYHQANKDKICERTRQWGTENKERKRQADKTHYEKLKASGRIQDYYGNVDRDAARERAKQWRKDNPGRVAAQLAKRRAVVKRATPPWAEWDQITALYEKCAQITKNTGVEHQVDHSVPLESPFVCGLHCIANLQILTAEDNNKKKCFFDPNWQPV